MRLYDILFGLAVLAWLLLAVDVAPAHSWYPWECCSDNDCAPVPRDQITEQDGGFKLPDGRHVPYAKTRMSPDGEFHLCEEKWPERIADRKILCFYAPVGGA